jgi:hypothetical protein
MDKALRIGIAVFNAGDHHAAHDAWEDEWLDLPKGSDDERFLHGLIQYTAAVYHTRNGNWSGARGLAESAAGYLADLSDVYRGVDVGAVREYLRRLAADPEFGERVRPLPVRYDGDALQAEDLSFEEAAAAATLLAEEYGTYDERVVGDAVGYARDAVETSEETAPRDGVVRGRSGSQFVALVFDFVGERAERPLVYDRLEAHVERRRSRERDVSDLFE